MMSAERNFLRLFFILLCMNFIVILFGEKEENEVRAEQSGLWHSLHSRHSSITPTAKIIQL